MDEATANINKLVSLTFDEDPSVRKQAAKSLGEIDDPAAIFALVELSYDKDPSVRELALSKLEKRKQSEAEVMSFAEIFSTGSEQAKPDAAAEQPSERKEKMLRPIAQLFERHLGKEKAEMVKSKMMPTIEKIYLKNMSQAPGDKKTQDESGRKAMQEFLTSYLEVISDIGQIGDSAAIPHAPSKRELREAMKSRAAERKSESQESAPHPPPQAQAPEPQDIQAAVEDASNPLSAELEVVGKNVSGSISSEISAIEAQESVDFKEQEGIEHLPDTFFKKAYEVMMLSGGDEKLMKSEMNRMIVDATREIGLAFRLAKKRFKETKITNITKITDGMRNINTDPLTVKSVEETTYQKTKSKVGSMTKVTVNDDGGNEGVIYLFDGRAGASLKSGVRIKVVKGMAKTFTSHGETALVLGKKGNVYIVL